MKYSKPLAIGVALFCFLGLWGCTQQKTGVINAKIQDLESRYSKMEEDYRVLQVNFEQNRKRLIQAETRRAGLEKENSELTQQLENTNNERASLRKQAAERASERDAARAHLAEFSKELQSLVGRVEIVLNPSTSNPSLSIVPASRQSSESRQ